MLKVKELMSHDDSLESQINNFLKSEKIEREDLIDIKYITVGMPQTIRTGVLVIYNK